MGKRGPRKKDMRMNALEGNPGNRKQVERCPVIDLSTGTLRVPFRLNKEEKVIWREVQSSFPKLYFTVADKHLLIIYCQVMGLIQRVRKAIANKPLVTTRANGSEYVNPLLKIIQQAETELMKLSEILGLAAHRKHRLG